MTPASLSRAFSGGASRIKSCALGGPACSPRLSPRRFAKNTNAFLEDVKREEGLATDLSPWLEALKTSTVWVKPAPLGRSVCRDPTDDKFIEAALAAGARTLIARDPDLTVLEKSFGIEILTPRAWLSRLPRAQRRLLD